MKADRSSERTELSSARRASDETARLALLRDVGILDSPPERSFDGLTSAAAALAECPIALISLLDEKRQWLKSASGTPAIETPIADSFCIHAVQGHGLFEVEDTRADSRFAENPLVTGEPHVRFYAGQPLELDGVPLGTLCVIDTRPRKLSESARHALAGLAYAAAALIAARRSERELQAHRRRLADLALASGDWLWDADVNHQIQWAAANTVAEGARDFLVHGAVLPDGFLLDGRGETIQPSVSFHSLLTGHAEIVRATIAVCGVSGTGYVSFSALPQFNGDGELAGFRGTARDVSAAVVQEQKRHETDVVLRLERDSAQRADKLRSELMSRVSHELRTPLNAMLGFSQLLLRDTVDRSDPKFYAVQINHAATHLLGLVNGMLDLARLESGREVFDLRPVATAGVIKRCTELMESDARKRGVDIEWNVDPDAEAVRADLRALTQVLLNLLSNALKWSLRGNKVTVTARRTTVGRLAIGVADAGPGIAPELIPALFQPFSQLSANTKRDGTGLGLSISRQLATAMGGDLSVTSTLGKGSCFTVALEAEEAAHLLPTESDFSALDAALAARPALPSLKVLYIEDDPVNALVLDGMMAHLGNVEVRHADTAEKGRKMLALCKFDLILLDMNLPDGHGLQVVRALRADLGTERIPIVALSADALPHSIELARAAGFDDYLTKPIDLVTLERLLTGFRTPHLPEPMTREIPMNQETAAATAAPVTPVALEQALEQSHEVKAKVEACADDLAQANEGAKKTIAAGATTLPARQTLDHNEAVETKVQECADDLDSVTKTLAMGIDELKAVEVALENSRDALDEVTASLASALASEERAHHRALHDHTTGLPNRALFDDRLAHALALAERHDWTIAVMFLDLDRFKSVNDVHGHAAGDVVLKEVSKRLAQDARDEDTVCRNGGDEFLYLLMNPQGRDNVEKIAAAVIENLERTIRVGQAQVTVRPSIGIAIYPGGGIDGEALIQTADAAMYRAKETACGYVIAEASIYRDRSKTRRAQN